MANSSPTISSPPPATGALPEALLLADRLQRRGRRLKTRVRIFEGRLEMHQNARLATAALFFIALVALEAFGRAPGVRHTVQLIEALLVVLFAVGFSILVRRTRRLERHLIRLRGLEVFFDRQERRVRGLPSGRPHESAQKLLDSQQGALARDLNLIGPHSLWTLIDETLTDGGEKRLIEWLFRTEPLPASEILRRQETVRSLRGEAWFFSRWGLHASPHADFRLSSAQISWFLKEPFVDRTFWRLLMASWVAWIGMWAGIVAHLYGWGLEISAWTGIFAVINILLLLRAPSPFLKGVGLSLHLAELEPIFAALERRARDRSPRLKALAPVIATAGPSREARKLNLVLAFLSVQANPLVNLLVNALMPWTLTASAALERRRRKIAYTFPQCLEELSEIEALASLVIFDRFQTRVYPEIAQDARPVDLAFTHLSHPLIERSRVVANSFAFPSGKSLGLITGSNMSGKSTFLRTIGINQVLANCGAPVFAETYRATPLRIESCIEVSDSLRDGYSYFYAEVHRLKRLLDDAAHAPASLVLIDEIFRGTNNRERQIGSRAVIRSLASLPHTAGFVSTHDLELTALPETLERVFNLHFREDFSDDGRMIFSYALRSGPCPTTNALKIMKLEGIPIEDTDRV